MHILDNITIQGAAAAASEYLGQLVNIRAELNSLRMDCRTPVQSSAYDAVLAAIADITTDAAERSAQLRAISDSGEYVVALIHISEIEADAEVEVVDCSCVCHAYDVVACCDCECYGYDDDDCPF